MDQEQERIEADLRGLLEGEVRCDDVFVQMYASDASIFEIKPLGVVRPRGTADVAACLRYAFEHHIPIHARGGESPKVEGFKLVVDLPLPESSQRPVPQDALASHQEIDGRGRSLLQRIRELVR